MANITAATVKDLREKTGAGMMDCKAALEASNGDVEAAVDWLRKKGLAKAAKKSGRVAAEGLIGLAVSGGKGVAWTENFEATATDGAGLLVARKPPGTVSGFSIRATLPADMMRAPSSSPPKSSMRA